VSTISSRKESMRKARQGYNWRAFLLCSFQLLLFDSQMYDQATISFLITFNFCQKTLIGSLQSFNIRFE